MRIFVMIALMALLTASVFVACQGNPQGGEKASGEHHHHHSDGGEKVVAPETASSRPNKDYNKIQMTADDGCKVEYKLENDAEWPQKEKHFSLTVEVWTKDGKADKDFAIEVDADMPEHGHGMNSQAKVTAIDGSKNKFKVSGMLFHMRGWWQIYIKVTTGCGPSMATFNTFVD